MKQFPFFKLTLILAFMTNTLFASNEGYPRPSDLAMDYLKALDSGNTTAISNLLADDCWVSAPFLDQPVPKQAWLEVTKSLKIAFPDFKHEVLDCFESGTKVSVRGIATGQNNGNFMGNPPSGNRINSHFSSIFELDASWKIKAIYIQFDQKNLEAQLMAGLPDQQAIIEANVQGILSAADAGDTERLLSFFAPDAKHYFSGVSNTNDELKKRVAAFKAGFPDVKRNIRILASGKNEVTVQGWLTGTNTGQFLGNPATGNRIKVSVLGIYKFNAAGKVIEAWVEMDTATLQNQLKTGLSVTDK